MGMELCAFDLLAGRGGEELGCLGLLAVSWAFGPPGKLLLASAAEVRHCSIS